MENKQYRLKIIKAGEEGEAIALMALLYTVNSERVELPAIVLSRESAMELVNDLKNLIAKI